MLIIHLRVSYAKNMRRDEVKTATFREIVQDFAFQIQKIDDFLFQKCHDQGHATRPSEL